jgi:hypothetical protein
LKFFADILRKMGIFQPRSCLQEFLSHLIKADTPLARGQRNVKKASFFLGLGLRIVLSAREGFAEMGL